MNDRQIISLVTFALFSSEAYGHYLIARNEENEKFIFYKPSTQAIFETLLLVGAFSILNGYAITELKKLL
tara:strand:- start:919 stop:1128 length:210 start_codon:yes stop_codon:yes gene_type:complete